MQVEAPSDLTRKDAHEPIMIHEATPEPVESCSLASKCVYDASMSDGPSFAIC
jgi:hypothetical protein